MNLDDLTLGQARELARQFSGCSVPKAEQSKIVPLGWNIVVLDRGFVYVGEVREVDEKWIIIEHAQNIRRWGTQGKGLGALANGPLPETVLDKCPTVRAYRDEVKHFLAVEEKSWSA